MNQGAEAAVRMALQGRESVQGGQHGSFFLRSSSRCKEAL